MRLFTSISMDSGMSINKVVGTGSMTRVDLHCHTLYTLSTSTSKRRSLGQWGGASGNRDFVVGLGRASATRCAEEE